MKRNRLSVRIATAAAALLAIGAVTSPVHATETTTIVHHTTGGYQLVVVPSQASQCDLLDTVFPGSGGAAKTMRNLSTSNPALINDVFFTCKADLYEGADSSCTAFKLSGCQCIQGCNQLFFP